MGKRERGEAVVSVAPSRSPKRVAVLGSTGTIGRLALEVISCFPERFEVVALTAGNRWETLAEQA
ncbi:MAG: hypothetical protein QUU85_07065, partial [Candidatus Eisenbacteria bacterium]|nr:hypothetical protein [Candidatus Eisenbacteria bacterium]